MKGSTGKAVGWKLLERFGVQGVQFVLQIVLARILSPEHYGALSVMVIFTTLANVFIQTGFNTSLIQGKDVEEEDYSSVFWVSLMITAVLYAAIFFATPLIANFYNMPDIIGPMRVISLMLFPGALNSIQLAKVSREMNFKKVFISNLSAIILSGIVSVTIALLGGGLWALVAQNLVTTVVVCIVMMFTVKWHPKLKCNLKRVGKLFKFGWKLLVSSLIDTVYQDLRSLVIGKKYDSGTLGYYNRGKQFPQFIINAINGAVQSVMLPALSKEQDEKTKVKSLMRNSIVVSSYVIFPMMMGLAVVASPLVSVLLTDKWLPAVPYLQIYCFTLAFTPVHSCNLQAINAMGRSDIFLRLEIIKKIIGISALAVAVFCFDSPIAIALTGVFTTLISCFINAYPSKKLMGYSYAEQMKDLLPSLLVTGLMGAITYSVILLGLKNWLTLIIQIVVGIVSYIALSALFKLKGFTFVLNIVKKLLKKKSNAASAEAEDKPEDKPKTPENKDFPRIRKATLGLSSSKDNKHLMINVKKEDKNNVEKIEEFLNTVDEYFPIPLSQKQNLKALSLKLYEKGTVVTREENGKIVSMLAGYTDNLENNLAYISVVATEKNAQGKGYSKALLNEFLQICKDKGVSAVHLYTTKGNATAIRLYESVGFVEYKPDNEPRPDDLHLICYIKE